MRISPKIGQSERVANPLCPSVSPRRAPFFRWRRVNSASIVVSRSSSRYRAGFSRGTGGLGPRRGGRPPCQHYTGPYVCVAPALELIV